MSAALEQGSIRGPTRSDLAGMLLILSTVIIVLGSGYIVKNGDAGLGDILALLFPQAYIAAEYLGFSVMPDYGVAGSLPIQLAICALGLAFILSGSMLLHFGRRRGSWARWVAFAGYSFILLSIGIIVAALFLR